MPSTAGLTVKDGALRKLDIQGLIEQAVANNAGVETLERIFSLAKDVRAEQAKEAWNRAMVEFQKKCPPIRKDSTAKIKSKRTGSQFSYSYASLDGVMAVIVPIMTELDLSISWRHRVESSKVTANCRISHGLGHFEESGEVAMPVGESDDGANPAQRVGIALTYAKRYALLSIVGIAPEDDPDAHGVGGYKPDLETDTSEEAARAPSTDKPPFRRPTFSEPPPTEPAEESSSRIISEAQNKRLWAIAYATVKKHGGDAKDLVSASIERKGYSSSKDIRMSDYNSICEDLEVPF